MRNACFAFFPPNKRKLKNGQTYIRVACCESHAWPMMLWLASRKRRNFRFRLRFSTKTGSAAAGVERWLLWLTQPHAPTYTYTHTIMQVKNSALLNLSACARRQLCVCVCVTHGYYENFHVDPWEALEKNYLIKMID